MIQGGRPGVHMHMHITLQMQTDSTGTHSEVVSISRSAVEHGDIEEAVCVYC